MENNIFGSRDAQCEKCHVIYRLGDEHVCDPNSIPASKEDVDLPDDEEMEDEDSANGDKPAKKKTKK